MIRTEITDSHQYGNPNTAEVLIQIMINSLVYCCVLYIHSDRTCTYNVTLWRVRVTIVDVKKTLLLLCHKGHDFRKKGLKVKRVLLFSTTFF
jgi:hypothetical protein